MTLHDRDRRLTTEQERTLFLDVDPRDCLLVDGAERLAPGSWRRVERKSRAAGGLVITSHRAGLLPTLLECQTTPVLLAELVHDLLDEVPGDQDHHSDGELLARHGGNVRDALRELYDLWAARA